MAEQVREVEQGDGWAVASLDALGDGPGFRKVRSPLGVTAFGVNAIVLPAGYRTNHHWHDDQEELYLVLDGTIDFHIGEEDEKTVKRLGPGGLARVDAATKRSLENSGDGEATYFCVGGKDGYVPRDGNVDEDAPAAGFTGQDD
jgi:mannose-6-phosphate isomerase-like protein (cupin superfamily)